MKKLILHLIALLLVCSAFSQEHAANKTISSTGWYRIASNSGNRANAEFTLRDFISGGGHSTLVFREGISYNDEQGLSFSVLSHNYYKTYTFTKVRILENTTYDPQYIEVYVQRTGSVNFSIYDNLQSHGWSSVNWEPGSVPSGYTVHEWDATVLFSANNASEQLTVDNNGNVGIGTTSPGAKLDIYAKGDGAELLKLNTERGWVFKQSGTGPNTQLIMQPVHNSKTFKIQSAGGTSVANFTAINNYGESRVVLVPNGGSVMIGSSEWTNYELGVKGTIGCGEIVVENVETWPDYVFADDYNLRPLSEVESYINKNKHLPDVPTEQEVKEEGVNLAEMNALLLQKIEELTLYVIELNKEIEELKKSK